VTDIIIADGPSPTPFPGQWRIGLSETPSTAWRARLLELAAADPVTAALRIQIDGSTLLFTSVDETQDVLSAIRALYRLLREANRLGR